MEEKERLRIVLKHLIEHNEGHAEDYKRWVELAVASGMDEAARLIKAAGDHVEKAGAALQKALGLVSVAFSFAGEGPRFTSTFSPFLMPCSCARLPMNRPNSRYPALPTRDVWGAS